MSETVEMFKRCAEAQWRGLPMEHRLNLNVRAMRHPDMAVVSPGQPRAEKPIWISLTEQTCRIITLMSIKE